MITREPSECGNSGKKKGACFRSKAARKKPKRKPLRVCGTNMGRGLFFVPRYWYARICSAECCVGERRRELSTMPTADNHGRRRIDSYNSLSNLVNLRISSTVTLSNADFDRGSFLCCRVDATFEAWRDKEDKSPLSDETPRVR